MNRRKILRITDNLLSEEISKEEAELLINIMPPSSLQGEDNALQHRVVKEEGCLKVYDSNDDERAYLQFGIGDISSGRYLHIQKMHSFVPNQGFCRMLLGKLEEIAVQEKIPNLLLEVDNHNSTAISVYEALGFQDLGPVENVSSNIDSMFMVKSLFYRE